MQTIPEAFERLQISINFQPETLSATLDFPQDFPAFKGHFPEMKLLPAVTSLQLILRTMEKVLKYPIQLKKIVKSQFKNPILPEEKIFLDIQYQQKESEIALKASLSSPGSPKLNAHLILIPKQRLKHARE